MEDIQNVRRREGIRGGRLQEVRMVESIGSREACSVDLGGGAENKE